MHVVIQIDKETQINKVFIISKYLVFLKFFAFSSEVPQDDEKFEYEVLDSHLDWLPLNFTTPQDEAALRKY